MGKRESDKLINEYLDALVDTGLYGETLVEARRILICRGIEEAIKNGLIPRRCIAVHYQTDRGNF